ncbi:apolipoprotein D-like [Aricia agestis]|uniref:apolipoprotein D-like n=1 Tax=Aricia agestis TaxID=91739 RepID=UPI001C2048E9|nr:apolipoprotein D-like [Aricia agestis]
MKVSRVLWTHKLSLMLLCALAGRATCTGLGKCPIYPQFPDYDITRMTGTWYEVERSFHLMEISASCTELRVELNDRQQLLITVNTLNRWTRGQTTSYGLGIPSHSGSSAFRYRLNNRMPYIIGRMLPGAGQYLVLATDYTQFAVVWSCTNYSIAHSDRIWILGRQRDIEAGLRARIYTILTQFKLDPDRLILAKNDNCTAPTEINTYDYFVFQSEK